MKRIVKVFLSCMLSLSLFGCQSTEMKEAKDAYNQEVARIKSEEQ